MSVDFKKYHKFSTLKCPNFHFKFPKKLTELLDVIKANKKYKLKQLKLVKEAEPVLDWINSLNKDDLESFLIDVYMADLMFIFAELCNKYFSI